MRGDKAYLYKSCESFNKEIDQVNLLLGKYAANLTSNQRDVFMHERDRIQQFITMNSSERRRVRDAVEKDVKHNYKSSRDDSASVRNVIHSNAEKRINMANAERIFEASKMCKKLHDELHIAIKKALVRSEPVRATVRKLSTQKLSPSQTTFGSDKW
jgi:hypothetical protein